MSIPPIHSLGGGVIIRGELRGPMEQESKILTHEEMLELAYEREQANEQLEEQKKEENCND